LNNHPFSWGGGAGIDTGTPLRAEFELNWLAGPEQGVIADVDSSDFTFMFNAIY